MVFLHPLFNIVIVLLVIGSYMEVYVLKKKSSILVWIVGVALVLLAGFRIHVGADYSIYNNLFVGFSLYTSYEDVWAKAFFQSSPEDMEWIFVLINKWVFDLGLPFFVVTFIIATISIGLKIKTIYQNLGYPILGILIYYISLYFFEDCGHIRQGIGTAICVFSFKYIKSRNLLMFLFVIYLALGFHKTAIVFLPAYWIVRIPMNSQKIFLIILVSILLSPFEIYRFAGGFIESIAPQDISEGYEGYVNDDFYGARLGFGLTDIVKLGFIALMIIYDKRACDRVKYYEYMRNLAIFGLCLFYIMRGAIIFAVRLPGVYMFFLNIFVVPSIVYALSSSVKKIIHNGLMVYLFLLYFNFTRNNAIRGNFTFGRYQNILFMK